MTSERDPRGSHLLRRRSHRGHSRSRHVRVLGGPRTAAERDCPVPHGGGAPTTPPSSNRHKLGPEQTSRSSPDPECSTGTPSRSSSASSGFSPARSVRPLLHASLMRSNEPPSGALGGGNDRAGRRRPPGPVVATEPQFERSVAWDCVLPSLAALYSSINLGVPARLVREPRRQRAHHPDGGRPSRPRLGPARPGPRVRNGIGRGSCAKAHAGAAGQCSRIATEPPSDEDDKTSWAWR